MIDFLKDIFSCFSLDGTWDENLLTILFLIMMIVCIIMLIFIIWMAANGADFGNVHTPIIYPIFIFR